jgi:hypothetical protein
MEREMFKTLPKVTPLAESQSGFGSLPVIKSTTEKPSFIDRVADYEIPKLWRDWDVRGIPRSIARELSPGERTHMQRRHDELYIGCSSFLPSEKDRVIAALSEMLGGYRSLQRQSEEAAVAALEVLRRLLARFPLWAIEQGCTVISDGAAMLNGRHVGIGWPPDDSQICLLIKEIVAPYEKLRVNAAALLIAPVQKKDSR